MVATPCTYGATHGATHGATDGRRTYDASDGRRADAACYGEAYGRRTHDAACACGRACASARARACECARVRVGAGVRVRACVRVHVCRLLTVELAWPAAPRAAEACVYCAWVNKLPDAALQSGRLCGCAGLHGLGCAGQAAQARSRRLGCAG